MPCAGGVGGRLPGKDSVEAAKISVLYLHSKSSVMSVNYQKKLKFGTKTEISIKMTKILLK